MKKLLITGASGFLGYHLLRAAPSDFEIYGLSHSNTFAFDNATHVKCDITNYIELGNLIEDIEPDAVIHAAAISDANFCQANREFSYEVNVTASINLAGICSDFQIPFAFTSTDLVFDGKTGMYREGEERNPLSVYGEQKAMAEDGVLKIYSNAVVFRLPLMLGYPHASDSNYTRKFISQIRNKERAKLFHDEYRSACGAGSIAQGIFQLMEQNSGVIHLAGKERLSRYDIGKKLMEAFVLDGAFIQSCSQQDVSMNAPRPADVSLDITKAVRLGFSPMVIDQELKIIANASC
jgi:dTDP-4-dehydrorhamnose reductase